MAIGERIHFFRIMRGMTQKYLGMLVGFPERSADVRLAQYETGSRKPKADLTAALAQALDVAPQALDIPDIDSYIGLMHTLFALEDIYGLTISETDGEVCLKVSKDKSKDAAELLKMLCAWQEQAAKLSAEEISREAVKKQITVSILIEVNIAGEDTKFGAAPEETEALVREIAQLPGIHIEGLMTIAPYVDDAEENRQYFSRLKPE